MHPFCFPQWNGSSQRFAINAQLDNSTLGARRDGLSKKRANDWFDFLWLCPMPQDTAPGTVVRHVFSSEIKELSEFMGSQFGPMSHAPTAILPCKFCQDADHQHTGQWIAHSTPM